MTATEIATERLARQQQAWAEYQRRVALIESWTLTQKLKAGAAERKPLALAR